VATLGIILIVIPDNTCVNSSIVCVKDTGMASVRYFGESHLAALCGFVRRYFVTFYMGVESRGGPGADISQEKFTLDLPQKFF